MNNRLAASAVRFRHCAPAGQPVAEAAATPADPMDGSPGPLTGKPRYLLTLHRLAADRRRPVFVLDEMAGVEPLNLEPINVGPISFEPLRFGPICFGALR